MVSSLRRLEIYARYKEKVFYSEGSEALEQAAQRSGGCPMPEDYQGKAGPGPGQYDLAVDVPVHFRGVGLDGL